MTNTSMGQSQLNIVNAVELSSLQSVETSLHLTPLSLMTSWSTLSFFFASYSYSIILRILFVNFLLSWFVFFVVVQSFNFNISKFKRALYFTKFYVLNSTTQIVYILFCQHYYSAFRTRTVTCNVICIFISFMISYVVLYILYVLLLCTMLFFMH